MRVHRGNPIYRTNNMVQNKINYIAFNSMRTNRWICSMLREEVIKMWLIIIICVDIRRMAYVRANVNPQFGWTKAVKCNWTIFKNSTSLASHVLYSSMFYSKNTFSNYIYNRSFQNVFRFSQRRAHYAI